MMKYRKLGRAGIDVGIIGLGAEYLEHVSRATVTSVVHEAIDKGVNYIDLFLASPGVRDNFGAALKNKRLQVMIAGHLGSVLQNGQYCRSRDKIVCQKFFEDLLTRLKTDYIDALMLHFVQKSDDYEAVFDSEGLLGLALKLKKEGKARFIGVSSHNVSMALKAVNSGHIDVLMFPVNPAFDTYLGDMEVEGTYKDILYRQLATADKESMLKRKALYHACAVRNVGLVAMKPYAAGVLFRENPSSIVLTPVQCLNYVLSQPAVCTVVPGCKNVAEMKAALSFLEATDEEKDYSTIKADSLLKLKGNCQYCNHCLPCPVGIDIGTTTRITDTAKYELNDSVVSSYEALAVLASACTECGACMERCPFGVDVISNMNRAVDIFGE